ncbi:MAG: hypothetical protein SCJ93_06805 [Bacillota bacterium]|nr:hypothetical protein [Bacillota bacterium]
MIIALAFISFTIFKGVTNILNAFFIPFLIFAFLKNNDYKEILFVYFALILSTLILYGIQSFFIIGYCMIAFLIHIQKKKKISDIKAIVLNAFFISFIFWMGIILTDTLFSTNINQIMLRISQNNILKYIFILIVEGLIISLMLNFSIRKVLKSGFKFID